MLYKRDLKTFPISLSLWKCFITLLKSSCISFLFRSKNCLKTRPHIFKIQHKYCEYKLKKVYPVLELSIESKLVFRLPIWDFVSFEPINSCLQVSRLESSYVINICNKSTTKQTSEAQNNLYNWCHVSQQCQQLLLQVIRTVKVGGFGVLSIDHDDLPVCFTLIDQSQSSQHLHFDYFSPRAHLRIEDTFLKKLRTVEFKCLFRVRVVPAPYFLCHIYQWDRCLRSILCRRPCGWGLPMSVWGESTRWTEQRPVIWLCECRPV